MTRKYTRVTNKQQIENLKNIKDPYRCLALVVIATAVAESKKLTDKGVTAPRWLQGDDPWLRFWCECAEVPFEKLHRRMVAG